MNEIQIIRRQLAAERTHAGAVASACAALETADGPGGEFQRACVDYLVGVLAWFEERDQRASDLAQERRSDLPAMQRSLAAALSQPGRSREALEKLERAVAAGSDAATRPEAAGLWLDFTRYFAGVWSARRENIDSRLGESLQVAEWRAVAGIDADSILEERRRYARVRAALPPHVTLPEAAPPSR